jgi:hypothetical protein
VTVASFLLVGHQPWAPLMVESIRRVTGYHVVQMSDLTTPEVDGADEVVRIPFRVPLMSYRLKHLANFPYDQWVTFDTDVLVKKGLDDVWHKPFDIAVTKRRPGKVTDTRDGTDVAPSMPFNTGVMFSREPQFWRDAYAWLRKQSDGVQAWYGDQLAVAEIASQDRYKVLKLPASEFNWTPATRDERSDARVWHYKGAEPKKWLLGEYVEYHGQN